MKPKESMREKAKRLGFKPLTREQEAENLAHNLGPDFWPPRGVGCEHGGYEETCDECAKKGRP